MSRLYYTMCCFTGVFKNFPRAFLFVCVLFLAFLIPTCWYLKREEKSRRTTRKKLPTGRKREKMFLYFAIYHTSVASRKKLGTICIISDLLYVLYELMICYFLPILFTLVNFYFKQMRRALHLIQALNGNKCYAYFVSG